MKKIFNYALLGAMLVASQSLIFANAGETKGVETLGTGINVEMTGAMNVGGAFEFEEKGLDTLGDGINLETTGSMNVGGAFEPEIEGLNTVGTGINLDVTSVNSVIE